MSAPDLGSCRLVLRVECHVNSVRVIRGVVRRLFEFPSTSDETAFVIAVSEIFANAVDEHHEAGIDADIEAVVDLGESPGVTVLDRGRGFRGTVRDDDEVDPIERRGRGLVIARAFAPGLSIVGTDAGTSVHLPLPPAAHPSSAGHPGGDR